MFGKKSEQRGCPRTSLQPEDDRSIFRVVLKRKTFSYDKLPFVVDKLPYQSHRCGEEPKEHVGIVGGVHIKEARVA